MSNDLKVESWSVESNNLNNLGVETKVSDSTAEIKQSVVWIMSLHKVNEDPKLLEDFLINTKSWFSSISPFPIYNEYNKEFTDDLSKNFFNIKYNSYYLWQDLLFNLNFYWEMVFNYLKLFSLPTNILDERVLNKFINLNLEVIDYLLDGWDKNTDIFSKKFKEVEDEIIDMYSGFESREAGILSQAEVNSLIDAMDDYSLWKSLIWDTLINKVDYDENESIIKDNVDDYIDYFKASKEELVKKENVEEWEKNKTTTLNYASRDFFFSDLKKIKEISPIHSNVLSILALKEEADWFGLELDIDYAIISKWLDLIIEFLEYLKANSYYDAALEYHSDLSEVENTINEDKDKLKDFFLENKVNLFFEKYANNDFQNQILAACNIESRNITFIQQSLKWIEDDLRVFYTYFSNWKVIDNYMTFVYYIQKLFNLNEYVILGTKWLDEVFELLFSVIDFMKINWVNTESSNLLKQIDSKNRQIAKIIK